MNADSTGATRLTSNPTLDDRPAWSPDGIKIAFQSNRADHTEIYMMDANGSGVIRLTDNLPNQCTHPFGCPGESAPSWSPDGTKIALDPLFRGREIYLANVDGSGVTQLTHNVATDAYPAWSPDGTKIAFGSDRDGNGELYVMNADGSGVVRLTHNSSFDGVPAW